MPFGASSPLPAPPPPALLSSSTYSSSQRTDSCWQRGCDVLKRCEQRGQERRAGGTRGGQGSGWGPCGQFERLRSSQFHAGRVGVGELPVDLQRLDARRRYARQAVGAGRCSSVHLVCRPPCLSVCLSVCRHSVPHELETAAAANLIHRCCR